MAFLQNYCRSANTNITVYLTPIVSFHCHLKFYCSSIRILRHSNFYILLFTTKVNQTLIISKPTIPENYLFQFQPLPKQTRPTQLKEARVTHPKVTIPFSQRQKIHVFSPTAYLSGAKFRIMLLWCERRV